MIRSVIVVLVMISTQARGEEIQIQSGEHSGFTRLALAIPEGRDWRLGRQGDGYAFESGEEADTFDLSTVYSLINRDRLARLEAGAFPGQLVFTLACVCHLTAFRWQSDWVIVDILDGLAPAGSPFEESLDAKLEVEQVATGLSTTTLDVFEITQSEGPLADFALDPIDLETSGPTAPFALPLLMIDQNASNMPTSLPATLGAQLPVSKTDTVRDNSIRTTERAIIESFARAASQGLLDITTAPDEMAETPIDHVAPDHTDPADEVPPLGDPLEFGNQSVEQGPSELAGFGLEIGSLDQPGIVSRTSVERDAPPAQVQESGSIVGDRCLDNSLFDMDNWGDDRDFSVQIGERISALTTEFDAYPEGAVEGLARNYLFFGFGREALQTLKVDSTDTQQRRVMAAMAYVADEEADPSGLFDSQRGCATQAAIWTILSGGTLTGTTQAERVAATEGFRTLPLMLRGHLGVRLAQLFMDFGDPDTAGTILQAARVQVTADRVETDVATAGMILETQGAEATIPALSAIADTDARLTPEALLNLINLTLDEGLQVDPNLISLADSMAYEHRNKAIRAELIDAQARAMIAAGSHTEVFALLSGDVAPMEASRLAELRGDAILSLIGKTDDAAFLNFAFDTLPESNSPEVENAVAERLLKLGFADRAEQLLTSPATGVAARDRRYLQAEIAFQLGDYSAVDGLLGGMTDPLAAEIKARAQAARGEFAAASISQNVLPGAATDAADAWRAGAWTVLEQSDDPLLRAASDAILAGPDLPDPETPLAASRALLEQATVTQELAGQLLERFAIDPAANPPAAK